VGIIGQRKKKEEKKEVRYFKKPNACSFCRRKFLLITGLCRLGVGGIEENFWGSIPFSDSMLGRVLVKRQF
jgi:hypothetical protein